MSGTPPPGTLAAAISNRVVQVISDHTGRGPTKSRTYIQDDLVAVVVQDTLTKGERTLVADGKADLVLALRKEFQATMRAELIVAVQEITGRKVIAFFSDNHIEPDAALEAFLLAPAID